MTDELQAVSFWRRCFRWRSVVSEIRISQIEQHNQIAELTRNLKGLEEQVEKSKGGNRALLKFIMAAHHLNLK